MKLINQLEQIQMDLGGMHSEIILAIGACLVLSLGLFKVPYWSIKMLFSIILCAVLFFWSGEERTAFEGYLLQGDWYNSIGKIITTSTLVLAVFKTTSHQRSSYYFLILLVLLGSLFMLQVRNLLLIYLSIEMVSYGSYLLTNFSLKKLAHESGMKFLLFGGVSSAIMLFGLSIIYGVSGRLQLETLSINTPYETMGFVMLLVGVLFKISAAPFHIWLPNVYQSAPVDTAAFFSIVPKLAGLVLLGNLIGQVNWGVEPVLIIGILTIIVGTTGALGQTNVRRLVGYGAIAHTGFLLPLVVIKDIDTTLFVWYGAFYAVMNVGVFHVINHLEGHKMHEMADYGGIGKSKPALGVGLTLILVSLIGIPPLAGFTAKWFLFSSLLQDYLITDSNLSLSYLIIAIFATTLALVYYLKVPFRMYFHASRNPDLSMGLGSAWVASIWALILVALFFFPSLLINII